MTTSSIQPVPPGPARSAANFHSSFFGLPRASRRRRPRLGRVAGAALLACAGGAWACEGPAARLVSMEGTVEVRPAGGGAWQAATPSQALCTGDTLAVRTLGRAAVVLPNEVVLRLDQGSVLTLKSFATDQPSELGLLQGALHVLTRFSKRFGVVTPYLNAMVDGTEFTVSVAEGATSVSVAEGHVRAENDAGQQTLAAGASARAAQGQAPAALTLRPRDAVQWALYFPQIVQASTEVLQGLPPAAQQAARLAAQGQYSEALQAWPAGADEALRSERAGWLLGVGRIQEAEALLQGESASTLAVRALIQVTRYETDAALATARRAAQLDGQSSAAQLALSYALQAQRDLPGALAAAQQAVQVAPQHVQAWARLAELQLSSGLLRDGEASAGRALALHPEAARAQTLLGFAQLLRGRDALARESLAKAQAQSPSDPLPHLGLGLSLLRGGQVAEGRREMEIAVMLDPGDAELRALLARAYLREQRDPLAADQIGLARELDPRSPTPWFLDGQRKQRANRPVEAAADYERALALNDQRAVVRPSSLLDTDRAARTAALASVWRDLGFDGALLSAGRQALSDDPQNEAAHRLLAQAYAANPRHETARVSELLQAQLRQSPRTEPVAPQELLPGLPVLNGPRALALQETGPLFDESRGGARLGLMGGSRGLFGSSATAWRSVGDGQISLGHFHYETDGFRDGADIKLDSNNVMWQTTLTPELNGQIELRSTQREGGDITQRLIPESSTPVRERGLDSDALRLGARYAPTPDSEWLASLVWVRKDITSKDTTRSGQLTVITEGQNDRSGQLAEVSYALRMNNKVRWTAGLSKYREDVEISTRATVLSLPVARPPTVSRSSPLMQHDLGFAYATIDGKPVTWHLGLSRDDLSRGLITAHTTNPKLGVAWTPIDRLQLRIAAFHSVKGSSAREQSIEPTQFAGFNQVFDDPDGTRSHTLAVALDHAAGQHDAWGAELSNRNLYVPTVPTSSTASCTIVCDFHWKERFHQLWWQHRFGDRWALWSSLEYQAQNLYDRTLNLPIATRTWQLPFKVSYFDPRGWSLYGQVRHANQSVRTTGSSGETSEQFWIADTGLRYRISNDIHFNLEVANLFDRQFLYQDTYLSGEPRVPLFQPRRTAMARVDIRF